MINNLVYPLLIGMALGKKKGLTKKESTKAAMMSYAGSAVGGNAGTVLGTVSAVNAEALQNKTETLKVQLNRVDGERALAEFDRATLVEAMTKATDGTYTIAKSAEVDAVYERIKRPQVPANGTNDNSNEMVEQMKMVVGSIKHLGQAIVSKLTTNGTGNPAPAAGGSTTGSPTGAGGSGTTTVNPGSASADSGTARSSPDTAVSAKGSKGAS